MSEGKLLSRKDIAKRIAAVERVKSQINWENNDCLPKAVAFTHGYPPDAHILGLHARAFVKQAMDASATVAQRSGEEARTDLFVIGNTKETKSTIKRDLKESDKAWIIYGDSERSHVLGVLRLDDDEFIVANLGKDEPYLTASSDQIADRLMEYSEHMALGACIVGFKKKPNGR